MSGTSTPSQSPQSYDLLFLLFVQDIGHAHGAYKPPPASMSQTLLSLAGFQVILIGRFWVIAEVSGMQSNLGSRMAPVRLIKSRKASCNPLVESGSPTVDVSRSQLLRGSFLHECESQIDGEYRDSGKLENCRVREPRPRRRYDLLVSQDLAADAKRTTHRE